MLLDWRPQRPSAATVDIIKTSNDSHPAKPAASPSKFPAPLAKPLPLLKRARPRADVDGEGSENLQKKKRRLRLNLITSRLSKPYATPATHIISRSALRIGIWARQKVLGRNLLRKVACLNSIRIKRLAAREAEQKRSEFARMVSMYNNVYVTDLDTVANGSRKQPPSPTTGSIPRQYDPPPPSPLGLSNYDAFDYEEDSTDEDEDDEDASGNDLVYSDFSALSADDSDSDEDSYFDPFGSNECKQPEVLDSGKEAIGLLLENEKCDEISVAHRVL
ncbi:hypothetical protein MMC07_001293 [Pseudocyphellaria aurata]|nr:hypothetical protein [Pseudocyphellaria aurata]